MEIGNLCRVPNFESLSHATVDTCGHFEKIIMPSQLYIYVKYTQSTKLSDFLCLVHLLKLTYSPVINGNPLDGRKKGVGGRWHWQCFFRFLPFQWKLNKFSIFLFFFSLGTLFFLVRLFLIRFCLVKVSTRHTWTEFFFFGILITLYELFNYFLLLNNILFGLELLCMGWQGLQGSNLVEMLLIFPSFHFFW